MCAETTLSSSTELMPLARLVFERERARVLARLPYADVRHTGATSIADPVPRAELEPRVFTRATDNWMELSARFVVPVRTARIVKDEMTRRIRNRLAEAGITISSETLEVTVHDER